jgi:cysteine desulfurase
LKRKKIEFVVNGSSDSFLPHILNVSFPGVNVESLLVNLDLAGIAVSSGSACTAGSIEPSHVLVAMLGNDERSRSAIRFSFGLGNTLEEMEEAAIKTAAIVRRIRW